MSDSAHNLSNSFLAVRLLALHEFPKDAGQGSGPFLVVQRGIAPDDPEMEPDDFVLTLEGTWLPVEEYFAIAPDDRADRAWFPSAAAVIELLEKLPPRPAVERRKASADDADTRPRAADQPRDDDRFDAALLRAIRGDTDPSSGG